MKNELPEYVTVAQAAKLLDLDAKTIHYHMDQGHLQGIKIHPRLIMLERAKVLAFTPAPRGPGKAGPAPTRRKSARKSKSQVS